VFSVDQDGFFTSMHADSGLAVARRVYGSSTATLVPDASDDNDASSTCSAASGTATTSWIRDEKTCRITTAVSDVRMSSLSTKSLKNSAECASSPSVWQLSGSSSTVSAGDVPTTDSLHGVQASIETIEREQARAVSIGRSHGDSSAATTFLSLVTITPPSSDDEEDGDLLTWSREWQRQSTTTKFGDREPVASMSTPLVDKNEYFSAIDDDAQSSNSLTSCRNLSDLTYGCLTIPRVTNKSNCRLGDDCIRSDVGFSTWPCSPVLKFDGAPVRGILKSTSSNQKVVPKSITFSPVADVSIGSLEHCYCGVSSCRGQLAEAGSKHRQTRVSFLRDRNEQGRSMTISTNAHQLGHGDMNSLNSTKKDVENIRGRPTPAGDEDQRCSDLAKTPDSNAATRTILTSSISAEQGFREPMAVCARLVISAPLPKQSSYVENYHRRMICRRVTRDELAELDHVCSVPQVCHGIVCDVLATGSVGQHGRSRARVRRESSVVVSRGMTAIRESPELQEPTSLPRGAGACRNGPSSPQREPTTTNVTGDHRVCFVGSDCPDMGQIATSSRPSPSPRSCSRCGGEVDIEPTTDNIQKWTKRRDLWSAMTTGRKVGKYCASKETDLVRQDQTSLKKQKRWGSSSGTTAAGISSDVVLKCGKEKARKTKRSFLHESSDGRLLPESPLGDSSDKGLELSNCDNAVGARTRCADDSLAMIESLVADLSQMTSSSDDGSDCSEQLTRSTESVSSMLSAASERHRIAKLAFFGIDSDAGDAATNPVVPMVSAAAVVNPFQLPMFDNRSVHCSDSCSSSGLGSSVSASPMESPNSDCSTSVSAVPLQGQGRRMTSCATDPKATHLFAQASAEHRPSEQVTSTTGLGFKRPCDPVRQSAKTHTITKQTAL